MKNNPPERRISDAAIDVIWRAMQGYRPSAKALDAERRMIDLLAKLKENGDEECR